MAIELQNCPKCGSTMILREAKRNGYKFWGCSAYGRTKCNGSRPYKAEKQTIERKETPTNVVGSGEQTAIWEKIKTGTKNLIVEAVAGSGKTFTVVHSLTYIAALRVIFTAFNSHIAEELASRVPENVLATTLHKFGLAQVRRHFGKIVINKHKLSDIILKLIPKDKDDREQEGKNVFLRNSVESLVRLCKYNLVNPKDESALDNLVEHHGLELNDSRNQIYTLVSTAFGMSIKDTKNVDFDDMIYFIFAHAIPVENYDIFIGDEIQDWNRMQQYMVMQSIRLGGRFIGVGDRFQSIYGFAGADVESIPNMIAMLSEHTRNVETLPLSQTRRCPITHVALAQQIVPHITAHRTELGTIEHMRQDEAIKTMQPSDMGISRRNAPLVKVAYTLLRNGTRAVLKGRNIGDGIISLITKLRAQTIPELIEKAENYRDQELEKLLAKGKKAEQQIANLDDKVDTLIALTEDMASIDQLIRKIQVLFDDSEQKDAVILSSVHRAKGLEANRVYIFEYDRIEIPMKQEWNIQQEKNLHYVALTRSLDALILVESEKRKK